MQNRLTSIILVLIIFSISASGQKLVNSPFSRFNLGTLEPAGSFRNISMGGAGTAFRDNNSIYFSNPASYSSIDTMSFIFDFGLDYGINILSDGTSKYSSDDMNFDHLLMGFPITKGWGVGIGIVPVSNGYYNLSKSVVEGDPDYDPITGGYTAFHKGDGNLSNFFLGSGINITKNLSAGINMSLLFGSLKRTNEFDFADYYYVYNDNMTERYSLSGINLDYGLQYSIPIKNDYFFIAGASLSAAKRCKSRFESISYRFNAYGSTDTLAYSADSSRSYIPGTFRAGITFGKKNKFVAGIDYVMTNWSKAKIHGSDGYLGDTRSILFGAEYIPDKSSNYSFVKRMEYRVGGHIGDNYLVINNEQVKEYGMSIGLGIPMRRPVSKTNLFLDFTRKSYAGGTVTHFENYFTMGVSINLYAFWFFKPKYD
jgi:hypothetical protein